MMQTKLTLIPILLRVRTPNEFRFRDLKKPQSLNKYQYAYNSPLRYVDPDGHDPEEEVETPDPPQGQGRSTTGPGSIPVPVGPGPTPAEAQQTVEALQRLNRAIDDALYPISQLIGTAPAGQIAPVQTTPLLPVPLPTIGTPPSTGRQPMPPPPITMGKGSTKDERKVNQGRAGSAKSGADAARAERDRWRALPNKTPTDKEALRRAERELQRQIDRMRKSEPHGRKPKGNQD